MSLVAKKFNGTQFIEFEYIQDSITIETGLFRVQTVPQAEIETTATVPVSANQRIRIEDPNGTVFFEGRAVSGGSYERTGRKTITVYTDAKRFVEDSVSYSEVDQSPEDHLNQIASNANASFNVTYQASATSTFAYGPDSKRVRRAIQDILDEPDIVAYFLMDGNELVVEDRNAGPQYRDVSTEQDPILIQQFEEGSIETVRNAVTVIPSGGRGLIDSATVTDSQSISDYGRRAKAYNIESIYTQSAAQKFANSLLQPEPLPSGKIQVAGGSDFYTELANQSIEVSDTPRNLTNESLLISRQTIRPNRVILEVGEAGAQVATQVNRGAQSSLETNKAGTIITEERVDKLDLETDQLTIADDASNPSAKAIFDVTAGNIRLFPDVGELIIGTLGDDIQTIHSSTLLTNSLGGQGGAPPFSLSGGTRTVLEPSSSGTGEIGTAAEYFDEMNAEDFITHSAPTFAGDARRDIQRADYGDKDLPKWVLPDAEDSDELATELSPDDGRISLDRMCSWLLSVCQSQDERIDELEGRISELEKHLSDSGGNSK